MAKLKSLEPTPKEKSTIDAELKMKEGTKTRNAYVPRTILALGLTTECAMKSPPGTIR